MPLWHRLGNLLSLAGGHKLQHCLSVCLSIIKTRLFLQIWPWKIRHQSILYRVLLAFDNDYGRILCFHQSVHQNIPIAAKSVGSFGNFGLVCDINSFFQHQVLWKKLVQNPLPDPPYLRKYSYRDVPLRPQKNWISLPLLNHDSQHGFRNNPTLMHSQRSPILLLWLCCHFDGDFACAFLV